MKNNSIRFILLGAFLPLVTFAQTVDVETSKTTSCAVVTQNLHYLSRDTNGSSNVSILQDFLNSKGYLKSQPSGFFGSATRKAVITFQNDNGLNATPPGFVGAGTRAKIKEISCGGNISAAAAINTKLASDLTTKTNEPVVKVAENIDSVINLRMNSDGFTKGEKYTGSGDMVQHDSRVLVKKSFFSSNYFGKKVSYAVINEASQGGVAGGSSRVIIQPEQKNVAGNLTYEFNQIQGFNPWNAGSDIKGGVNQSDYTLIGDAELVVTYKVSEDVVYPSAVNKCIKRGDYNATYTLDKIKHMYIPTDKKDSLIEAVCLNQRAG